MSNLNQSSRDPSNSKAEKSFALIAFSRWPSTSGISLKRIVPMSIRSSTELSLTFLGTTIDVLTSPYEYSDPVNHQFRFKPASLSDPNLPLIPVQSKPPTAIGAHHFTDSMNASQA